MTPNTPMTELSEKVDEARRDLQALGINLDTLVVRSHPFGELIDSQTRKVFTPPLGDAAYVICRALKVLSPALSQSLRAPAGEADFYALHSPTRMHIGLWPKKAHAEQAAKEYENCTITPLYASPPSEGVKVTDDAAIERACRAFVGSSWDGETEFLKDQYRSNMRRAVITLGRTS